MTEVEKLTGIYQQLEDVGLVVIAGKKATAELMVSHDVVPVVRCRDCVSFEEKYHTVGKETGKEYCGGYCYHWDYEQGMSPNQIDGNDFCSYGERRTNAKTD